jgi:hypothetical protein
MRFQGTVFVNIELSLITPLNKTMANRPLVRDAKTGGQFA